MPWDIAYVVATVTVVVEYMYVVQTYMAVCTTINIDLLPGAISCGLQTCFGHGNGCGGLPMQGFS